VLFSFIIFFQTRVHKVQNAKAKTDVLIGDGHINNADTFRQI